MSISIIEKHTKTIYDSNKKKIFKFPCDTELDRIIMDLWGHIARYIGIVCYPYALGNSNTAYPGYRNLKRDEFNAKKFVNYCLENDNTIYNFGNPTSIEYIAVDGHYILLSGRYLDCENLTQINKKSDPCVLVRKFQESSYLNIMVPINTQFPSNYKLEF